MRRPLIALVLPLLLSPLAAACEPNPLEPGEVAAAYALEAVDGEPLPLVTYRDALVTFTLLADTIRLLEDGIGSQVRMTRTEWADPTRPDGVITTPSAMYYQLRGRRIEIGYGCPLMAAAGPVERGALAVRTSVGGDAPQPTSCAPVTTMIGLLDGDALRVYNGQSELRYRRVDP